MAYSMLVLFLVIMSDEKSYAMPLIMNLLKFLNKIFSNSRLKHKLQLSCNTMIMLAFALFMFAYGFVLFPQ